MEKIICHTKGILEIKENISLEKLCKELENAMINEE